MLKLDSYRIASIRDSVGIVQQCIDVGVVSLPECVKLINKARQHGVIKEAKSADYVCGATPGCDGTMILYQRRDLDGSLVTISKCNRCQYSTIVQGGN